MIRGHLAELQTIVPFSVETLVMSVQETGCLGTESDREKFLVGVGGDVWTGIRRSRRYPGMTKDVGHLVAG